MARLETEQNPEGEARANRMPVPAAAFARLVHQSAEPCLISDCDSQIVYANPAFFAMVGYGPDEVLGQSPAQFASGRVQAVDFQAMLQSLEAEGCWEGEVWSKHRDGGVLAHWLLLSALTDENGRITHCVANFADVELRQEASDRLAYLAYHDPLTHLPNRLAFESQLDMVLRSCQRDGRQVALMLIDLDRFKNVNDTLGHHVGDELLKSVAVRLRESVRASDIVARLGGDEFVVVLPDIESALTAAGIAGKVQRNLEGSHKVGEHILYATPSIGISVFPSDGRTPDLLLRNADAAMYHAKSAGRNNYQFYAVRMNEAAGERLRLENELRAAVAAITPDFSPFELHFQPQFHLGSGQVVGLEALVRWRHPEHGIVSPLQFIPLAEDTGLIQPLGDWIFWETCRQVARLRQQGVSGIRVAVNISAQQLRNEMLPVVVQGALACYDLTPADLELEITESVAMQNPEITLGILNQLSGMGIVLAIDDFGTGYSSLAYLKHLPIQRLKLDRSFVKDIETDVNDAAICSATVALGHNLGLELVAEGVESTAQRDFLQKLGCDVLQGYLYSRPMPADDLLAHLREQSLI